MFQSMGERMNKAFSVIIRHLRSILGCARTEATEFDLIFSSMLVSSIGKKHSGSVNSLTLM